MQAQHLNDLKVVNLKKLATAAMIRGRSKMKKAELINALIWMFPSGVPVALLLAPRRTSQKSVYNAALRPSLRSRYGPYTVPPTKSRKPRAKKSRKTQS